MKNPQQNTDKPNSVAHCNSLDFFLGYRDSSAYINNEIHYINVQKDKIIPFYCFAFWDKVIFVIQIHFELRILLNAEVTFKNPVLMQKKHLR